MKNTRFYYTGLLIKYYRKKHNVMAAHLAKHFNMSRQSFYQMEVGHHLFKDKKNLNKISKILNIPTEQLMKATQLDAYYKAVVIHGVSDFQERLQIMIEEFEDELMKEDISLLVDSICEQQKEIENANSK